MCVTRNIILYKTMRNNDRILSCIARLVMFVQTNMFFLSEAANSVNHALIGFETATLVPMELTN